MILVFGNSFRQEFLNRFCFYVHDEDTKSEAYFFRKIPSREVYPEVSVQNMWTLDEVPDFILESGFTSLEYTL